MQSFNDLKPPQKPSNTVGNNNRIQRTRYNRYILPWYGQMQDHYWLLRNKNYWLKTRAINICFFENYWSEEYFWNCYIEPSIWLNYYRKIVEFEHNSQSMGFTLRLKSHKTSSNFIMIINRNWQLNNRRSTSELEQLKYKFKSKN